MKKAHVSLDRLAVGLAGRAMAVEVRVFAQIGAQLVKKTQVRGSTGHIALVILTQGRKLLQMA